MDVWRGLAEVPPNLSAVTATIGTFDGVHLGHQALLDAVVADGATPIVVTFDPHPLSVVAPSRAPLLLTTLPHRLELIESRGISGVLLLPFTRALAGQTGEEFVLSVLVQALRVGRVIVGNNFRFGSRALGDVGLLEQLGDREGFTVTDMRLRSDGEGVISSTEIRGLIHDGQVEQAAKALGRDHRITGVVVSGDKRGRVLGYPTANVSVEPGLAIPGDGIYAGWLVDRSDGVRRAAAISVGSNPTFGGTERRVEAFVLDVPSDYQIYERCVDIHFSFRLRDSIAFSSAEALLGQMSEDVSEVRALLLRPISNP
jgi:riboflavin kinase / FMN adenylyltransferase